MDFVNNSTITSTDNKTTIGHIAASIRRITGKPGSFYTLAITGTSTWKPITPTCRGVLIGLDSAVSGGWKS